MKNKLFLTALLALTFQGIFCMESSSGIMQENNSFSGLSTDELPYYIFDFLTKDITQGTQEKNLTNLKKHIENANTLAPLRRVCKRFAGLVKEYLKEENETPIESLAKKYNIPKRAVILHIINTLPMLGIDTKELLLNKYPADNSLDLRVPAKAGNLALVQSLVQKNADVNLKIHPSFATPLVLATREGHTEIAKEIIMAGADLDSQTWHGSTALIIASQQGYTEIVKMLIEAGANINIRQRVDTNRNALEWAQANGHTEIVTLLQKTDPNIRAFDCTLQ
jgi:hypothetical protein